MDAGFSVFLSFYSVEVRFERLSDLLSLGVVAVRDDVDDGVFVSFWVIEVIGFRGRFVV